MERLLKRPENIKVVQYTTDYVKALSSLIFYNGEHVCCDGKTIGFADSYPTILDSESRDTIFITTPSQEYLCLWKMYIGQILSIGYLADGDTEWVRDGELILKVVALKNVIAIKIHQRA